ncbi:hypothetical protein ABD91_25615 [Lysinibacillus sphaericus]|uniref:hypothetical protein n=1 Tax=Lysinibacillus sphaericus TaxID=1421 RepID=UPI0018CD9448|nr:hypothetical protein [Lysinibacillus sphaericus]MBG9694122.1 hypothetical protein [Lysinibacillus sphaericus]
MSDLEFENLKNSVPAEPIFKKDPEETELFILEAEISPYSKKVEELISALQGITTKSKSKNKFESAKMFDRSAINYGIEEALKIIKTMMSKEELVQSSYIIRFYSNGETVQSAQRKYFKRFSAAIFEQLDKIKLQEKGSTAATQNVPEISQPNPVQTNPVQIQDSEVSDERINLELEGIANAFKMKSRGNVKGKSPHHMTKTFEIEKGINQTLSYMKQNGEIVEYEFINIAIRFMIAQFYPEYTKTLKPLEELNYKTLVKIQNDQ